MLFSSPVVQLAVIAICVGDTLASSVSETFLRSIRSPRPVAARSSPERNQTCLVESHNDGKTDDSAYIAKAVKACANGGHILFPRTMSYVVGAAVNMSGLTNVDIDIQGLIKFTDDMEYWRSGSNMFDLTYQNATSYFLVGGRDVNVYGGGMLDGQGQRWWDHYPANKKDKRPVVLVTTEMHGGSISDLNMRQTPQWANLVINSAHVVFTNISIRSVSDNHNFEKNTDGWDIYRSDHIIIQNSTVTNGDDCVSFKPNSTNVIVRNMFCNGTHGISVGSLGQYPTQADFVENILVSNIDMYNSSEGARIKVWPDSFAEKSLSLSGGGGRGRVRNVTYENMWLDNVDYGLTITQCYGQDDEEECFKHPSKLNITDIAFRNIRGRTNRVFSPIVAHLVCSSPHTCSNISAQNIDIRTINGSNEVTCRNMDNKLLDLNCVERSKGYNPA